MTERGGADGAPYNSWDGDGILFSARLTSADTGMPKAAAMLDSVLRVGLFVPRSNCRMYRSCRFLPAVLCSSRWPRRMIRHYALTSFPN